ncbi:MAG: hypothetical protein U5R48_19000 [Gammaproteobacteria bacterium]|nr:hypothetical protein [Gammaproteobacteria bacterium]
MAVERDEGNPVIIEYVLRELRQDPATGESLLHAFNPDDEDMVATGGMRFVAEMVDRVDPLEFEVGTASSCARRFRSLFGVEFNPGNWNSGHVVLAPAERSCPAR